MICGFPEGQQLVTVSACCNFFSFFCVDLRKMASCMQRSGSGAQQSSSASGVGVLQYALIMQAARKQGSRDPRSRVGVFCTCLQSTSKYRSRSVRGTYTYEVVGPTRRPTYVASQDLKARFIL